MKNLINIFESFPRLNPMAKEAFGEKFQQIEVEKGGLLEKEGQVASYLYYISEGSARSFYIREKRDITVSFTMKGEFVTSMYSFVTRKKSYENIEALEKCTVYRISYDDLQNLFLVFPEIEHVYRLILEQYYIMLEEQLVFSKFKTAKERYLELMDNRPQVIQKASVGDIASFLDMSIETLSRVRSKI